MWKSIRHVFERLEGEQKTSFKNVREALVAAFGGTATGIHIVMMEFRKRERKPEVDIQVFAYNLESLLRRAMPKLCGNERDILTIYRKDKSCVKERTFTAAENFLWRNGVSGATARFGHYIFVKRQRKSYQPNHHKLDRK